MFRPHTHSKRHTEVISAVMSIWRAIIAYLKGLSHRSFPKLEGRHIITPALILNNVNYAGVLGKPEAAQIIDLVNGWLCELTDRNN